MFYVLKVPLFVVLLATYCFCTGKNELQCHLLTYILVLQQDIVLSFHMHSNNEQRSC